MNSVTVKNRISCYVFGMVMPGREHTGPENYRYGFQGQEKDDEVKGENNSLAFTYRIYDPRVGKFFSIDPLTSKYPNNSPYSFSENSVIAFIELEGLEKVTFQTYSFAPFEKFGGGYKGNGSKRKYGDPIVETKGKENYKIGAQVKIDLATDEVISKRPLGSQSVHMPTGVEAYSESEFEKFNYKKGNLSLSLAGNNDAFFWGASADIDVHAGVGFLLNKDKTELFVTGYVIGDKFPSNETYLTDEKGSKVFLGVSGAEGGPFTSLPLNGSKNMCDFSFNITLDKDGNFTGVKTMDGKSYTLDEWNKQFEKLDPKKGETGTNVKENGTVQTETK